MSILNFTSLKMGRLEFKNHKKLENSKQRDTFFVPQPRLEYVVKLVVAAASTRGRSGTCSGADPTSSQDVWLEGSSYGSINREQADKLFENGGNDVNKASFTV
jgi:hypothetical protein